MSDSEITTRELADQMNLSRARISQLVKQLNKEGKQVGRVDRGWRMFSPADVETVQGMYRRSYTK